MLFPISSILPLFDLRVVLVWYAGGHRTIASRRLGTIRKDVQAARVVLELP